MNSPVNQPVRYGFLGCGMMGQEHLRNIALLPEAQVRVIFEPDAGMRAKSAALAPLARQVESMQALLDAQDIDCIVITSPNFLHASQMQAIAQGRALPLMVEKPVCTSLDDVAALRKLGSTYNAPIWVAMEYRYMPPIAALVREVHSQTHTGPVTLLSLREHRFPFLEKVGDWNRFNKNTGGTLVEKCCHFFDLMRLVTQSEPVRVFASASQAHNHLDERYGDAVPDILDNAFVIFDFASGQRAMLELCMFAEGSRYQEEVCVVGRDAKLECFVPGPTRFWPEATLGPSPTPKVVISPRHPKGPVELEVPVDPQLLEAGDHNGSTFYQHQKFHRMMQGHAQAVEVSLNDGLKAVLMGLAAQESARTGQAIDLRSGAYDITGLG
jgi:myo-inositol 2-dehydrogenase / D-chiro-inositol 1-dehydrogenase